MPGNVRCEYCMGDIVMVDGILGPQTFCPDCRRFQPERESTIATALRWWIETRQVSQALASPAQ